YRPVTLGPLCRRGVLGCASLVTPMPKDPCPPALLDLMVVSAAPRALLVRRSPVFSLPSQVATNFDELAGCAASRSLNPGPSAGRPASQAAPQSALIRRAASPGPPGPGSGSSAAVNLSGFRRYKPAPAILLPAYYWERVLQVITCKALSRQSGLGLDSA